MTTRRALGGLVLATLALAGCDRLLPGGAGAPPAFRGVDITGGEVGRRLELPDLDGRTRTLADFKGSVVVVFFGYTQCPDVCPTTLAELSRLKTALGSDGERLQVVFVTIDPERDTPEVLRPYMGSFDPSFVALRGTPEQTAAATKDFKIYYAKAGQSAAGYTIDHTAGSVVIDPQGRARLFVRYGAPADDLTQDVRALLKEG